MFNIIASGRVQDYYRQIETADINQINIVGQNLLHQAIINGQVEIANDLIQRGINLNVKDERGLAPLHLCGVYKQSEIAKNILDSGGEVNIVDIHNNNNINNNNPLWTAVFNAKGQYQVVEVLSRYNADYDSINKYDKTPLDFAKQIGDDYIIFLAARYH